MKTYLIWVASLLLTLATSTFTPAQDKPRKEVPITGKTVAKSRGANPNIKKDVPTVDVPEPKPAKTRGALCRIHFDNYTGLHIKIYVDGNYKGALSPWDDGWVTVGTGYTTIYCVSTGGTREWNASGDCREDYYYKLQ